MNLDFSRLIEVDISNMNQSKIPCIIQSNNNEKLQIKLKEKKELYNLTGCKVKYEITKPNGSTCEGEVDVTAPASGFGIIYLTEDILDIVGVHKINLDIITPNQQIKVKGLKYEVISNEDNFNNDDVVDSEEDTTDKNNIVSEESSDSDTNNSTTIGKDITYISNEVSLIRQHELDIDFDNLSRKSSNASFMLGEMNTSEIIANLKRSNISIDLTRLDVSINIKGKSYDLEKIPCEKLDAVNGKILIKIPNKFVDEVAENSFNVYLQDGERILKSPTFTYKIIDTLQDGIPGDDVELSYLQAKIVEVQQMENTIEDLKDKFNKTVANVTNGSESATNTEIVLARGDKTTLGERLDSSEEKISVLKEETNTQFKGKANISEVRYKNEAITMNDLHTDVKQAMTGGSVPVVGLDSVGKENLKNNSVEPTKVNESLVIRGIPCINYLKDTLKAPLNNFYKESVAKIVEVEDRSLSHLDITKVTKHTISQGTTSQYGTMIYGRLMHGINGVNIHDLANKNVRISFFAKSNRDFNITLSLQFAGDVIKEVDLPITSKYNYFSIEGLLKSENYNESNTNFSFIIYEKSSNMISDTDIFIGGVQILVDNNDKTCVSVNVNDNYYSKVDIDLLKSGLNGAYPRINELKNSLTNPGGNWHNGEKYFKITSKSNNDFAHLGVKSITHHENSEVAIASGGIIYLGRIQAIDLSKGVNKKIKFKTFIRANSNLQVYVAFSANLDSVKLLNLNTDWDVIDLEFDFSKSDIDKTDLRIYTQGINELPIGTYIELAGCQILVGDNAYSDFIFTLNQHDDYYNYYPKVNKKILVPPKIYSVANDLDSARNQAVSIYIDHLLDTCFDENVVFNDTNKDFTVIEPYFEQHDKYTNAINKGVNKYTEIVSKKIDSTIYNTSDFNTQHISTKSSVGRAEHPKVLFIGDSITAGVGVRNFGLGIADQAYPYWIHCKNLFDMDKIDAGNKENEFNFTCLGYGGGELYDDVYREASINYKGVTTSSRQSSAGMSSWSLEKVMTNPTSPFYDDSVEGTYKFSIKKFIEKYRTMDDEGHRLTLDSPNKGTLVKSEEFINKINVCNPTHIILQHGRNSEETIEDFLLALDEFIRIVKNEFPDVK